MNKKPVTPTQYDRIISKVIRKGRKRPIHEVMVKMVQEASKYRITEDTCLEKS